MKKLFLYLLSFIFIITSSGVMVNMHYCMGKLAGTSMSLVSNTTKKCDKCGMEKSKKKVTFKFLNEKEEREIDDIRDSWNGLGSAPVVTKRLEKLIKSVEGNKDPMNIRNFIETLPILDSQNFRKFVVKNKPGVDLTQTVIAPSGEKVTFNIDFGVEFFRPFYGI